LDAHVVGRGGARRRQGAQQALRAPEADGGRGEEGGGEGDGQEGEEGEGTSEREAHARGLPARGWIARRVTTKGKRLPAATVGDQPATIALHLSERRKALPPRRPRRGRPGGGRRFTWIADVDPGGAPTPSQPPPSRTPGEES